jgi:hypothetical protein
MAGFADQVAAGDLSPEAAAGEVLGLIGKTG